MTKLTPTSAASAMPNSTAPNTTSAMNDHVSAHPCPALALPGKVTDRVPPWGADQIQERSRLLVLFAGCRLCGMT
jgi:hypothetical protein